jgi:hypothetical protein
MKNRQRPPAASSALSGGCGTLESGLSRQPVLHLHTWSETAALCQVVRSDRYTLAPCGVGIDVLVELDRTALSRFVRRGRSPPAEILTRDFYGALLVSVMGGFRGGSLGDIRLTGHGQLLALIHRQPIQVALLLP